MKKTLLATAPLLALLVACSSGESKLADDMAQVTVCGQTVNAGDSLVLLAASESMTSPLDTAVSDGKSAVLQTKVGKYGSLLYVIRVKNGDFTDEAYPVILEPAKAIVMTLPQSKDASPSFDDSKSNDLWYECQGKAMALVTELQEYFPALQNPLADPERTKEAQQKIESAQADIFKFYSSKIIDNAPSAFSDIMLGACYETFDDSTLSVVMDKLALCAADMPNYQVVKATLEAKAKSAEGKPFADFSMMSIDGKMVTLSDIVKANKLTLVDFWASWCGPCRAEMPSVVKAYETFGKLGFTVVGVSLDTDAQAWTSAVNNLGMKWLQLSDLKGWQCQAAQLYSVDAIPSCFLIDSEGVIVAKNLRGDELIEKVAELLH